jgi:predicted DNA-binding protein
LPVSHVRRNIMLPVELDAELESVSRMTGENRSELVRRALSHYLDLIDLDIATQRARRYESGETKALTSEQLRRALTK